MSEESVALIVVAVISGGFSVLAAWAGISNRRQLKPSNGTKLAVMIENTNDRVTVVEERQRHIASQVNKLVAKCPYWVLDEQEDLPH